MTDFLLLEGGTDKLLLEGGTDRLVLETDRAFVDFETFSEGASLTNGATLTSSQANSQGGTWSVTATAAATALAAAASHGARGARVNGTSGYWQGVFQEPVAHTDQRVLSGYFAPTTTGAVTYLGAVLNAASNVANWRINADGSVSLRNLTTVPTGGGPSTYLLDLTGATRYRYEWTLLKDTDGQKLEIFIGDDTIPVISLTGIFTTGTRTGFYFGIGAIAAGSSIDYDTVRVTDLAPGPYQSSGSVTPPSSGIFLNPLKANVLGDSLTYMRGNGVTNITAALSARGWDSTKIQVSGVTGRLIWGGSTHPDTSETIATWRTASPTDEADIWILALGANNHGASQANLQSYYLSLLSLIGPGRNVRFIDQGFQNVEGNKWAYNGALAIGARYTKVTGSGLTAAQCSEVNAAIRNVADIANNNLTTYPAVSVFDWNNYAPMRADGTSVWDLTDTSSLDGTARHMTDAGYLTHRAPFYAQAVAQDFEVNNGAMFAAM